MAMFDKKKSEEENVSVAPQPAAAPPKPMPSAPAPSSKAVIGNTIKLSGDLQGEEDLLVEGTVEGTISLKQNNLTIGQSATVKANITAQIVRIEGEVTGDIQGLDQVVITQAGRVQGNIKAPRIVVEDGAKFKGSIEMDGFETTKPAAVAPAPKAAS